MKKAKKFLIWGGAGIGVLACIFTGLLLLLPQFVDMDAIGRNVTATLQSRYNIRSEHVTIAFFPYPHAVIYGSRTTVPDVLTVSADSVSVYPSILPLLSGKFRPAQIKVVGPKIAIKLPEQTPSEKTSDADEVEERQARENAEKAASARISRLRDRLIQLQAMLSAALPGIIFDMDGGVLELYSEKERLFWFEDVDARATMLASGIDFELSSGKSGLWNAFSFIGHIDPRTWKGSGEMNLTGGAPQDLLAYFFPSFGCRVVESEIDMTFTLSAGGTKEIRADFTASVPHMTVEEGPDKATLQNGIIGGTCSIDSQKIDVGLTRFRFDYPRISVTGRFVKDFAGQSVSLDLEGRDTDAAAVRDVVLSMDEGNPVTCRIFDIIREGEVPYIAFSSRAPTVSELKKMEHYTIRGSIYNGVVFAPKAELLVSEVSGDVYIEQGILYGTDLYGKTPGSSTASGSLIVGLRRGDPTFHLDLPLSSDLTELPAVLNRVVKNEPFIHELDLMKDIKGKAEGRLILGEKLDEVVVNLETGPFQLSGFYGRLPAFTECEGASFTMHGSKIGARALTAKSGKSSLTQVDFSYDWSGQKILELNSQVSAVISLNLIEPLIRGRENWKAAFPSSGGPFKGAIGFDTLQFKGPLGEPSKWVFDAGGSVDDITVQTKYFTGPLGLKSGKFEANRDTITLKRVNASLPDTALEISGAVTGYFDKARSAELTAGGKIGPSGNRDIATIAGFPPTLRALTNITLDHSNFSWERSGKTVFDGEILVAAGPRVDIRVLRGPEVVSIEKLDVKDADSDASLSLEFREKLFKIGLSGSLHNRTVDKILSENKLLTGPIQGQFAAQFYLDNPRKSTAQGQVKISGFQLPIGLKIPARIESALLEASENRINIKSGMISWNGSRVSLGGTVTMAENAYLVDMSAFADTLDLETILNERKDQPAGGENQGDASLAESQQKSGKSWDAPVRGTIRVRSERFTYGHLMWNPANADVIISPGSFEVKINQANLCGISTPGTVKVSGGAVKMAITPEAKDQDAEPAVSCLLGKDHLLTGKFTLKGNLFSDVNGPGLTDKLQGDVDLTVKNGRIFGVTSMVKIISLLSITEIYRGQLPDLFNEGCAFDTLRIKGKIKDGKLTLANSAMDGSCMKMAFRGEVDLARKKMDVVALVSPLRTVDRIIELVPIVNKVLETGLVSVPVRMSGDVTDPSVVPLSPTAVGEELFGFMKRTFKLPLTILQPLAESGQGG